MLSKIYIFKTVIRPCRRDEYLVWWKNYISMDAIKIKRKKEVLSCLLTVLVNGKGQQQGLGSSAYEQ